VCKTWVECRPGTRGKLDEHIGREHPETQAKQEATFRDLLGLQEGEILMSDNNETVGGMTPTKTKRAPKAKAEPKLKIVKPEKVAINCLCGCGTLCKPGSSFLTGHDARLDGRLSKWRDNGGPFPVDEVLAAKILPTFHKGKYALLATAEGRVEVDKARAAAQEAAIAKKAEQEMAKEAAAKAKAEAVPAA